MIESLARIRVVLVATSHPANIGAAARAMRTMGLDALHLVAPERFPCAEATAMASGAGDVLERARVHERLSDAIRGCGLVVGTTARDRALPWPVHAPGTCARRLLDAARDGTAALVFGCERTGLTNDDIELCSMLLCIPTVAEYRSLNLAQAVQVACYELRRTALELTGASVAAPERDARLATAEELALLYDEMKRVMTATGFYDPDHPRRLMRRLHRLFNRAGIDENELNILRGFLASVAVLAAQRGGGQD